MEFQVETAAQKAPKASGKQSVEETPHPRKKVKTYDRHKSRHAEGGSKPHSSKGKEQVGAVRETHTPRPQRPRFIKELYQTSAGKGDKSEPDVGHWTLENELLKMTSTMEKLKVELLAKAIVKYKKSACFEMGLVHMGQVLYEYVYRVALAQFKPDTRLGN
ncbi:hypothetical protein B296_00002491 [Ensete ventricosum]|uniref:Uncharacterized protein n=1 Tax=Ensete ventricosum TaxID=4639 RepID=A0A427B0W9_ENSVE|nr:hypothetical protein B296_00002491 [Ensete ventricosum]